MLERRSSHNVDLGSVVATRDDRLDEELIREIQDLYRASRDLDKRLARNDDSSAGADRELAHNVERIKKMENILAARHFHPLSLHLGRKYPKLQDSAEDVAQETIIKVLRKINQFKFNSRFKTYLYAAGRNTALNALNKSKISALDNASTLDADSGYRDDGEDAEFLSTVQPSWQHEETFSRHTPEDHEISQQNIELIRQFSRRLSKIVHEDLSEQARAVYLMRDRDSKSYEQIANAMNIPEGTVRSILSRARDTIFSELGWDSDTSNRAEDDRHAIKSLRIKSLSELLNFK